METNLQAGWLILLTGFLLGLRHALDPDHVTAVTHFISIEPDTRKGIWFGFRWALGHAVTVFALGTLVILLGLKLSSGFEWLAEILVGVSLIGLGVWRLILLFEGKTHRHLHRHDGLSPHMHPHGHDPASGHVHPYAPTLMGMLHGAAGTMAVFLLIPVSFMVSPGFTFLYMAVFSLGCLISMTFYGRLAGSLYGQASSRNEPLFVNLVLATSFVGILLGCFWVIRSLSHA